MRFVDLLRLSLSALSQHKVRTLLTILGVTFGSFVLVISLSMGQGVQETIQREYQKYAELQQIEVYPHHQPSQEQPPEEEINIPEEVSEERRERLKKELIRRWQSMHPPKQIRLQKSRLEQLKKIPHVAKVKPILTPYVQVVLGEKAEETSTVALPPDDALTQARLVHGRMFTENEQAILITEALLYRLGIVTDEQVQNILGKPIQIEYRTGNFSSPLMLLRLMGREPILLSAQREKLLGKILKKLPDALSKVELTEAEKQSLQLLLAQTKELKIPKPKVLTAQLKIVGVIRGMTGEEGNRRWSWMYQNADIVLPSELAVDLYFRSRRNPESGLNRVIVEVDDTEQVKAVAATIDEMGLRTRSLVELIEREQFTYLLIFACMTVIAIVALLVAALGITNTMFMSVLERVREIGIMKAVGARDGQVQLTFLVEGGLIGIVGGCFGVLLGMATSFPADAWTRSMVQEKLRVELSDSIFVFPLWLTLGVPVLACVVTTLAAWFPARRASKINPVTALRHE